jgi:methanogenic corrinoid protein MtbC1
MKADTLRAWERRYQLPQPDRSEGGHRLFSDFDIAVIKWLQARQEEGMRISQAVDLWRDIESSGQDPLEGFSAPSQTTAFQVIADTDTQTLDDLTDQWIKAALVYDEATSEHILTRAFAQFPLETVCTDLLYPALVEIGTLWYRGEITVQQEHYASELTIRKLQALIAAAPVATHPQKILVGCPAGEHHTISALMITMLLKYRGWIVIYFGSNVPKDQLVETVIETKPDLVVLTATRLSTAASLQKAALLMKEENIPLAFGGWIFNQSEELHQKIPAHFLGSSLKGAIPAIEKLVFNKSAAMQVSELSVEIDSDLKTKQAFLDNRAQIEIQAVLNLNRNKEKVLLASRFQGANEFLAQDISAALSLGDISLLGLNLKWAEGLLLNRGLSRDLFQDYLSAYREAVEEYLGEVGKPIAKWLPKVITNNQTEGE